MTYPSPAVQELIATYFVPVRLLINRAENRAHFRTYRVIWTPTTAVLDRRGAEHYQSPGYLPPELYAPMLRIGLGRAMTAWSRYNEAEALLLGVAEDPASPWAPEALYWLGVTYYLQARNRTALMRAWQRLRDEHPISLWAARVPPNQDEEE